MSSKKETTNQAVVGSKAVGKRRRNPPAVHTAAQKAQAVLALWTERVKAAEVLRTMGIPYITLQQWQDRAMEGMLQALEPRTNLTDGAALSPRLKALLQKRQLAAANPEKLQARLTKLQEIAPEGQSGSNA